MTVGARILIASPMVAPEPEAATVAYGYARALRQYAQDVSVDVLGPDAMFAPEDVDDTGYSLDVVKARSRIARIACESARAYTHVWWWDTDVIVRDLTVPVRMLAANQDIIGCAYPRKQRRWDLVAEYAATESAAGRRPTASGCELASVELPVYADGIARRPGDLVEVHGLGMGFMLTRVEALRAMWNRYESTLHFGDVMHGKRHLTVALFQLVSPAERGEAMGEFGPLLSEDHSFCWRARQCGLKVHLFTGAGTPLDHAGPELFRGTVQP